MMKWLKWRLSMMQPLFSDAYTDTGYTPKTSIKEGVANFINWYKKLLQSLKFVNSVIYFYNIMFPIISSNCIVFLNAF